MELQQQINLGLQSGYKIICINTTSHHYLLEKLKKIYNPYFEFNYFEGLFHKKSETIKNTKIIDKAVDEYQKNKSKDPLVIVNPELDINSYSFLEMLNKFDHIKQAVPKYILILIDSDKLDLSNKLHNIAYFIDGDILTDAECKNILGSKWKSLSNNIKNECKTMGYDNLLSLHRKCNNDNKPYLDSFITLKDSVVPKNEFVTKLDNSGHIFGLDKLGDWVTKRKALFSGDHPINIKGISIVGIPGTGKSISSKLISQLLDIPLYRFNIHNIMDSYVGNSEKNTLSALEYIDQIAPCVVLVDEIDKMFGHYSQSDSQASKRVLGTILTFMENSNNIFWVFTGNNVENIPPELLRKGRLDEYFYVNLPDREAIAAYVDNKVKQFNDHGVKFRVDQTNMIIQHALNSKLLICDVETIMNDIYLDGFQDKHILNETVSSVLLNSVSSYMRHKDDFDRILEWSRYNAKTAN